MKPWTWLMQYGIAILFVVLLAVILGELPLFRDSTLGGTKLSASRLVQALGYGSALVLLWVAARHAARHRTESGLGVAVLKHMLIPSIALITVLLGHQVLSLLVGPFLGKTVKALYNWTFIVGTVTAAVWVAVAWFRNAAAILEHVPAVKGRRHGDELAAQRNG